MTPTTRTPKLTVRALALLAVVLIGTVLGGLRAASMAATKPDRSTLVVNGVSYTVTHAEEVKGLSDADLGGMSHGVQSLVSDDKALVTVTLVVAAGDSPSRYDAGVLRAYAAGSSKTIAPVGGTLSPGKVGAHARIEGSLSFVVPRNGAQLSLQAPGDPRQVPLLQVDVAPAGADKHTHTSANTTTGGAPKPNRP